MNNEENESNLVAYEKQLTQDCQRLLQPFAPVTFDDVNDLKFFLLAYLQKVEKIKYLEKTINDMLVEQPAMN